MLQQVPADAGQLFGIVLRQRSLRDMGEGAANLFRMFGSDAVENRAVMIEQQPATAAQRSRQQQTEADHQFSLEPDARGKSAVPTGTALPGTDESLVVGFLLGPRV